jgi:hypothetical protein
MHPAVHELDSIVEKGVSLLTDLETDTFRLQQWLAEREAVFSRLRSAGAELAESDRQTVGAFIEEILRVDATILPRLEERLHATGKEILATRKLQQLLDHGPHAQSPLLFRRAL